MVEVVQMSLKEADRYAVIKQVLERTMAQSDAALWLNISVRQVKRLVRAIRQDGAQGAVSKRWGVPSNRRISPAIRDQFVGLVRDNYSDGPTRLHGQCRDTARLDDRGRAMEGQALKGQARSQPA